MTSKKVFYVAVHGGAGLHGRTSEAQVKGAMKRACTEAIQTTSKLPCASALSIVEQAISILEDDDCLNAGYGSNLTFDGTVECDAAIMDGRTGDFGSVGAVSAPIVSSGHAPPWTIRLIADSCAVLASLARPTRRTAATGIRNPIKLANAVLAHARVPDRLGRIRPLTLVSSGAHAFARRSAIETVDAPRMVAPRARADWQTWMTRYDEAAAATGEREREAEAAGAAVLPLPQDAVMQDTVGAVAWDAEGNLAAGVSSGGLLLKCSGRIGEAATFGAGCWAEQSQDGQTGMACSISGAGEHIMRAGLARTIANVLRPHRGSTEVDVHDSLTRTLSTHFYDPIVARGDVHPDGGVLLITKEARESGDVIPRLWCAFTTESMAVAYADSETLTSKGKILRRPKSSQPNLATSTSPVYITALPLHG